MYSELCTQQVHQCFKLYSSALLLLIVILLPYLRYLQHRQGVADMVNFCEKIKMGSEEAQNDITFDHFLRVLSQNPYQGVWLSSIKESKLLKQQNGTIELKTKEKTSENQKIDYILNIKIYDGRYRDNSYYQIKLNSSSIKTEQQLALNQVIFETASPVIGLYHKQRIFMSEKQKPIFINKLKFRLNLQQSLKIELLLAAQYDINVISESLEETWPLFNQFVFSFLILCQVLIQAYGAYGLILEAEDQDLIANSISPTFLKMAICFDVVQLMVLFYIIYYENLRILLFPTFLLFLHVIYLESYLYQKISKPFKSSISQPESSQAQLHTSPQLSPFFGNKNLQYLVSAVQKNQNYLMCICSYLVFYVNNMQNYIYILFFIIIAIPQIIRNCRIGSKVNYSYENILCLAYPRIIPLFYVRFFGLNTLFLLEPHFLFCIVCVMLAVVGGCVLYIQNQHGSRSILPKFLIPKGMKTKFKYFAIQDQNMVCIVCRSQLSQIPAELKKSADIMGLKQEITYNRVVLTPCHHRFHAHCLQKWMQNRTECPSCSYTLPPSQGQ